MQRESYNQIIHNYKQAGRQKNKSDFINNILKKHPGILYYSEERDEFLLNPFYLTEQAQRWEDANSWKEDKVSYIQRTMERERVAYKQAAYKAAYGLDKKKVAMLIEPYCGRYITEKERDELRDKIVALFPVKPETKVSLKPLIKKYGYNMQSNAGKRKFKIEKMKEEKCEN